jgi:protein PsiE
VSATAQGPVRLGASPLPSSPEGNEEAEGGASVRQRDRSLAFLHLVERVFLMIIVALTLAGATMEVLVAWRAGTVSLADILLMFLYLEVIGMVAVYYADRDSVFVYPIFIAITALTRLVILQGKDIRPETILYECISILLLALAAVVIGRMRRR